MRSRRDVWRNFMGRFEPSADPREAVERGFYVPRPGRSIAEQLAVRFEVKPSASHLIVGGVGSGKTTQLLVARDRLAAQGDVCAVYADVSLDTDLSGIDSTALLCVAGLSLGKRLPAEAKTSDIDAALDRFSSDCRWHDDAFDRIANDVAAVRAALAKSYPDVVVLLDSLDRMTDLRGFRALIEGGVMKLRSLGIGVILVGPLTALYGIQRTTLDQFDRTWHLPTVDVQNDAEGREFLLRVLRVRDGDGLLTDPAAERLAAVSGGVLRDLMALTQTAGEEAYVDGAERIEVTHVEVAADHFGRKHLVAIDSEQLAVLHQVRAKGTFVQTSEKDLALLATRRVLEYANGKPRFAVHPTIEPLLAQIAEAP